MKKMDDECYPEQALKQEFEVSLHFSEEVRGVSDVEGEWIRILKDTYIKQYLEGRRRKTDEKEGDLLISGEYQ